MMHPSVVLYQIEIKQASTQLSLPQCLTPADQVQLLRAVEAVINIRHEISRLTHDLDRGCTT